MSTYVYKQTQSAGRDAGARVAVHPYCIALNLGRQIRFNANLDDIKNELENKLKGLIA